MELVRLYLKSVNRRKINSRLSCPCRHQAVPRRRRRPKSPRQGEPHHTLRPEHSCGYSQGWYTDPVGIWVNSEQVNVCWNWYGIFSCAFPSSISAGVPASFPGWNQTMNSLYPTWYCAPAPPVFASEYGGSEYAVWTNSVFPGCLGATATAYYYPLAATGNNNGYLVGNFAWALTGPGPLCIDMLTPHFQLVRTYN